MDRWFAPRIPVREILACPIEDMPAGRTYDLIVMNNVLEHCYSTKGVMDKILEASHEGTVFVFHDKLYRHELVREKAERRYDAAHPLRVDGGAITRFLDDHFDELFSRTVYKPSDEEDLMFNIDWIYYIGARSASQPLTA